MQLIINIPKRELKARTINEAKNKVTQFCSYTSTKYTDGIVAYHQRTDTFLVYNIVKKKATRIRHKDIWGKKFYKVTKQAEVTIFVYEFSSELLKLAKLKLKQNSRNFELIPLF